MYRLLLIFLFITINLYAEDAEVLSGHSYHGEAFNEGPRQAAYLMGGTGDVEFEISTKSEQAKKFFLQGLGQLHGFWYFEAERSFRQAALYDPKCAMNYWGMALANTKNEKRARDFLYKAYENISGITDREKMYIDAYAERLGMPKDEKGLAEFKKKKKSFKAQKSEKDRRGNYVSALEEIIIKYPDDLEAKAFLVVTLWENSSNGHKLNSHITVNSLAMEIIKKKPLHPTHHFIIHLWDRKKPELALKSAALCGEGSPSIAHMWHMPGHIYSRLHRYSDAAWQQEASARTDHSHMMRDLVLPDQIHNFAHNNEWLTRNLVNLGRVDDALSLAKNMCELPRHPKYNTLKKGSSNYGRTRIFQVLRTFEMWDEVIALKDSPYLEETNIDKEKLKRLKLLGKAYFFKGDSANGEEMISEVENLSAEIEKKAIEEEKKKQEKKKKEDAKKKDKKKEVAEKEDKKEGKKEDKKEKNEEERKKSGDELYAEETLKELKLLKAYADKSLTKEMIDDKKLAGIDNWVKLKVLLSMKEFDRAVKITETDYKKSQNKNKVIYLAHHINALYEAGKKEEAKKVFDELRLVSEDIDFNTAPILRLTAAATEFGYPEDWRLPYKDFGDLGKRPALSEIGPFRWQPVSAQEWTLPDHEGKSVSFQNFRKDKAVVLIFYLGASCLHCVEQLNKFAPMKENYSEAGIELIAVSLETVKDLKSSISKYSDDGKFPFPIVANEDLEIFKKYRCYDDFENFALHGTFLIDKHGFIRWHDISYDPFTNPEFLLKESKRLLSQPDKMVYGKEMVGK
ncbi:MAG: peroxiredoxin family protein, partial [Lentisphaeraceae bacterium]|nr:peroxiredoxin family protein [Lentisphaeraceae bacterium]